VLALNMTDNYGGHIITGLTLTSACAGSGDSGGAAVSRPWSGPPGPVRLQVQAQGIVLASSGTCTGGATSTFEPINTILHNNGIPHYENFVMYNPSPT
jgi:hypothetical protein